MLLQAQVTPETEIRDPVLRQAGVSLWIKRLDQVHPLISGNKWFKLKYNLIAAREQGLDSLLSFGGAYSNHIHALAAAGTAYGFKTIGMIRGEPHSPLNPTLQFAVDQGMQLHYLDRTTYRQKESAAFIDQLRDRFGDFYLVPEGGSNALAVKGCTEIIDGIDQDFDVLACACGSGGTLAGLIAGLQGQGQVLGVAVLKGGDFLTKDVINLLQQSGSPVFENWNIDVQQHFGGYAKHRPELLDFIRRFEQVHGIPLDQVYTGKMMYALWEKIRAGQFAPGTRIMALHSGGLQGRLPELIRSKA